MFQRMRTCSAFSSLSVAAILLIQLGVTCAAQVDRFREDLQKAESALNQRKYEDSITAYKASIRDTKGMTPENFALANAQANIGLSRAYLGLGAFKNAIQSCDEALKYTNGNVPLEIMAHNQRGLAIVASFQKPGDPALENAVAEFRKVLALSDQDPMVSYNLGVTLLKLNKDTEGIHELQMFVARAGRTPEAATALKMIDEPRRARETFAPDFSITTRNGEFVTLEDLKGKVVLMDFWGSWCPPCRESTPSLVKYSKKHSSETFTIVGIAVNEASEQGWREYIDTHKMEWPQYLDSSHKMANLFKITAFPTYIIIDADGVIRDRRLGWTNDTMSFIDEQVKRAEKARKAGPPTLKPAPDRITAGPPQPASTTPAAAAPVVPPVPARVVTSTLAITPAVVAASTPPAAPTGAVNSVPSVGFSVRGHVTRLPGATPTLRVNLIQPAQAGIPAVPTSSVVNPDGSFEFFNVRPGNYNINLSMPVPFQTVVVSNGDVNGLEFTLPAMKSVTGRATMDGTGVMPQRLLVTVIYPNGGTTLIATIQPDGAFNVLMPEGEHRVAISSPGYYVRSMGYGSSDLLRDPLRLSISDSAPLLVSVTPTPTAAPTGPTAVPQLGAPTTVGRGIVPTGQVTEPIVLTTVPAQYTSQARALGIEGSVALQGVVRTDGTVANLRLTRSLDSGLDQAAIDAVSQWRFRPGTQGGVPVEVQLTFQMTFSLK